MPLRKGRPVRFTMPALNAPADLVAALGSVAKAVSDCELTPDEAAAIASLLNSQTQAIELVQFKAELEELRRKVMGNATGDAQRVGQDQKPVQSVVRRR
jgi:hypothetical protein